MPAGRPSAYKKEYNEQAYKFCLLGADDVYLGQSFGVSEKTINTWKKKYPEFLQSIKKGKDIADAEIAHSLFHRAKGFSHPDVDIRVIKDKIVKTKLTKHYPPDTGAAFIWLKNRSKENWRDKQDENKDHDIQQQVDNVIRIIRATKEHADSNE